MRDHLAIPRLRTALIEATRHWPEQPPYVVGHRGPAEVAAPRQRCHQCGGNEFGSVDMRVIDGRNPWYCKTCSPNAEAQFSELTERLSRQTPRNTLAHQRKAYRAGVARAAQEIGHRFAGCWFRTYQPTDPSQALAVEQLQKWTGDPQARQRFPFLVLHGAPGLGKTHLLVAAWRKLARKTGCASFHNEGRFVSEWHRSHQAYDRNGGYSGSTPAELIEDACTARWLIWDDLGKAKLTTAWDQALYQIIDYRYAHGLPTLMSTNFSPTELPTRIAEWTADRVLSGLSFVVEGRSMRIAA